MEPTKPVSTPNAEDNWFSLPDLNDRSSDPSGGAVTRAPCKDASPGPSSSEQTHPVALPKSRSSNHELTNAQHPEDRHCNLTTAFRGDDIPSPNKAQSHARPFPRFPDTVTGNPTSTVSFPTGEVSTRKQVSGPVYPPSIRKKPANDFKSSSNSSSPPSSPASFPASPISPVMEESSRAPQTTDGAEHTAPPIPENGDTDVSTESDEVPAIGERKGREVNAGDTASFPSLRARQYYREQRAVADQHSSPGALQPAGRPPQAADEESQGVSLPSHSSKPSVLKKLLLGESAGSPYWRTLNTDDTTSALEDQPENVPTRVAFNADAGQQAAENIASAASTDEGAEGEVGTVKKVLLVPTPTTSVIDETAEAPRELRSGVLSIVGIDDEESGDPAPETDISLQSSTGVQFRQIKPERRSNLWASSRIHDGATLSEDSWRSTTLRKTSIFARFVAPMSTAFRSAILVATTRRFFMLIIFGLATMMPSFQWIEYSIVSSLMQRHYHVSSSTICWTSMIFHVGYITSVFPCAWILDNYGLRVTVVCSCCLTVIGSCIKLLSVATDRFSLVLIGQAFPAYATAFTATVPTRLASAWFKYDELSAASAAAMLGPHFGTALGFFVPPHVVNTDNVERSLRMLCILVAVMSCLALLVTIVAFDEKPEHPLSFSEMLNLSARTKPSLKGEMHSMLGDRYFILLLLSYGLNVGCLYSILTLLNPIILTYFPDEASFAGLLGLSIVSSGVLGSWVGGIVVDKTSMFKEVTLTMYVCSGVALLLFAALVPIRSHTFTMIVCLFLGFFMIGYIPLGMQLAAEMTYPHSEWLPACFLGISAQGVGLVLIPVCAFVKDEFGVVAANGFMTAVLVIGCLMTAMLRAQLRRQDAFNRVQRDRPRMFPPPASDRTSSTDDEQPEL